MRTKVIQIQECEECTFLQGSDRCSEVANKHRQPKRIKNTNKIPRWCPLEEKTEKQQALAAEIYLLFSCDQWHSHSSMQLLGVFTDWNTMVINHLEKYLSTDEIIELKSGQTQGRNQNYIVQIETLNPIYK